MGTPLAHTITDACARSGMGRTSIYQLIKTGRLPAQKSGRKTLILEADLQHLLQSLPTINAKSRHKKQGDVL